MSKESSSRITKVCPQCGSDDVSRDATVRWDVDTQDWEITGLHDGFFCDDCCSELNDLDDKELPPPLDPGVEQLLAAARSAEDRLGALIKLGDEGHGGPSKDNQAALNALQAALKPFADQPAESTSSEPEAVNLTPFEQFVASGREVSDLSQFVPDVVKGRAGILYDAGLYIEREVLGTLYLRLGNQEFAEIPAANQRRLEAILYEWSVSDGARADSSMEQSAASEAAHYICGFTTIESRTRATLAQLQELTPGVCHVQDIADVWTILDKVAAEGTNLDLAYELMRGLLALE